MREIHRHPGEGHARKREEPVVGECCLNRVSWSGGLLRLSRKQEIRKE
jgi:hypothetical protein